MRITVKSDVDKLIKKLNYLEKKQIPFATSKAINTVAFKVKTGLDGSTKQYIDRPKPFTRKPTAYTKSTKRNLVATVFVKPKQLAYLNYIIYGKSERNRAVPTGGRTNAYGNLARTYIKTRVKKKTFFSGTPKGGDRPDGLYERRNRNTKLKQHAVYKDSVNHRRVWPFHKIAKKIVNRHFERELHKEIAEAIRTAR